MQAAGKTLFLMTSSYADYAKFILSKILVDETGNPIDYWKYFDICIGDARKPDFFLKDDPFCTNKNDYPFEPVDEIKPKTWYSQGKWKLRVLPVSLFQPEVISLMICFPREYQNSPIIFQYAIEKTGNRLLFWR